MKIQKVLAGMALVTVMTASLASVGSAAVSEAQIVANALISRQVADQVKEFNALGVNYVTVKVEQFNDLDVITLEGTIIRSIACGTAKMTIKKTSEPAPMGFGRVTRYQAAIEKNEVPNCR